MPVLPIRNTVTGGIGLPDHGYVGTAMVRAEDVLWHWRYALGIPGLVAAPTDDLDSVVSQREVTVRNHHELAIHLHAFRRFGADYITARYPQGRWMPAPKFEDISAHCLLESIPTTEESSNLRAPAILDPDHLR